MDAATARLSAIHGHLAQQQPQPPPPCSGVAAAATGAAPLGKQLQKPAVGPSAAVSGAAATGAAPPGQPAYPTPTMRAHFEEHGYCVVDDAVDPAMLPELLAASRRIRDRVHSGSLTHGFMHRTGREPPFSDLPEPWGSKRTKTSLIYPHVRP